MIGNHESSDRCDDCGIVIAGGNAGCRSLFEELIALHFSSAVYFGVHRLFVDTYCLQHPDQGSVSFKSMAAHLGHLCWTLERGGSRAVPSEPIRRWLERHPDLERPAPPRSRGTLTVGHVSSTQTPAEHHRAVEEWARTTWEAYATLQPTARQWVDQAFAEYNGKRGDAAWQRRKARSSGR